MGLRDRQRIDDEPEMSEVWKDYRQQQQARRALRLPLRTEEILALRQSNFDVRQLTDYQFRVDGRLDLYPIHRRFHDIKTGKRGTYQTAKAITVRVLRTSSGGE